MNLKTILKYIKYQESTISMILGAIIIVVVGIILVNYFSTKKGETIPSTQIENQSLPTTHIVSKGEDLWKISEEYYNTGYEWERIAKENGIKNVNQIEVGQKLTIPAIEQSNKIEPLITNTPTSTPKPSLNPQPKSSNIVQVNQQSPISGSSYTVEKGDTLWHIAVRAYGDGYKWIDISRANELVNPNLIHPGNVFVIPR